MEFSRFREEMKMKLGINAPYSGFVGDTKDPFFKEIKQDVEDLFTKIVNKSIVDQTALPVQIKATLAPLLPSLQGIQIIRDIIIATKDIKALKRVPIWSWKKELYDCLIRMNESDKIQMLSYLICLVRNKLENMSEEECFRIIHKIVKDCQIDVKFFRDQDHIDRTSSEGRLVLKFLCTLQIIDKGSVDEASLLAAFKKYRIIDFEDQYWIAFQCSISPYTKPSHTDLPGLCKLLKLNLEDRKAFIDNIIKNKLSLCEYLDLLSLIPEEESRLDIATIIAPGLIHEYIDMFKLGELSRADILRKVLKEYPMPMSSIENFKIRDTELLESVLLDFPTNLTLFKLWDRDSYANLPEKVLLKLFENGHMLVEVPAEVRSDPKVWLKILQKMPSYYDTHLPPTLKDSREFIYQALASNVGLWKYLPKEMTTDPDFYAKAIELNPLLIERIKWSEVESGQILAAIYFASMVMHCDQYASIIEGLEDKKAQAQWEHYMKIAKDLPLELQQILALRTHGLSGDIIPNKFVNWAFGYVLAFLEHRA